MSSWHLSLRSEREIVLVLLPSAKHLIFDLFNRLRRYVHVHLEVLLSANLLDCFDLHLFHLSQSLAAVSVNLLLKQTLHLLLDFLLINLHLLFLLLLHLLVSRRLYFFDLEAHAANLNNVAFREPLALDVLPCVVAVLDYFPEHALRVLKQVFFLDVVERVRLHLLQFCIFGDLAGSVHAAVALLVIDPPVSISTCGDLGYQASLFFLLE